MELSKVKSLLRNSIIPFGREIKSTFLLREDEENIDVGVVIKPIKGKTSMRFSEEWNSRFLHKSWKPKVNNKIVNFDFYYEGELCG
jgi:hypothetical protein